MINYADVKQILEDSIGGGSIGAHGAFWRSLTRDQFVQSRIFGQQLIVLTSANTFDPVNSALMQAIEGRPPFDGSRWRRMPAGRPPIPPTSIQRIREWIIMGCPA